MVRLLQGQSLDENQEFCDFTLEEQNESTSAKGVTPSAPSVFSPQVKKNVFYIVATVLINNEGEVLMMQEAKSSCAGQWYLPAGRMEAEESIVEAAKREVLEETGLDMETTTLLAVESAGGTWYRFVVTGAVTGGKLKTPADADSESLQAKWIGDLTELSLRSADIYNLVTLAKQYHMTRTDPWHSDLMPTEWGHTKLLLRLVICVKSKTNNRVNVLVSQKTEAHLPTCEINPTRSLHSTLKKYMTEIFGSDLPPHRPAGLLSVEHDGKTSFECDGLCLTMIVPVRKALEEVTLIDKYCWTELTKAFGEQLLARLGKNMAVPLNVIR